MAPPGSKSLANHQDRLYNIVRWDAECHREPVLLQVPRERGKEE